MFACASLISAWLYLSHGFSPHSDGVGIAGLQNPGAVFKLILMFFGGPFSNFQIQIGMAVGFASLTAVTFVAVNAWSRRRFGFIEAALSFVLASSIVIILGRFPIHWIESRLINQQELLPGRYYTPVFLVCACLVVYLARKLESATRWGRLLLSVLAFALSGSLMMSIPAQQRYARAWVDHYRTLDSTFAGVLTGASDQLYMASLLEDQGLRDSAASIAERRGWSGFGDFRASLLGKSVNELAIEMDSGCVLHFDQFVQNGDRHTRLAGWAWNATSLSPPRDLLFVCPDGLICGIGRTGLRRPDLHDVIGNLEDARPGFLGYAKGRHAYGNLRVYFLLSKNKACEAQVR